MKTVTSEIILFVKSFHSKYEAYNVICHNLVIHFLFQIYKNTPTCLRTFPNLGLERLK